MHPTRVTLASIAESVDYGVTASSATSPVGPKFLRITDIQDGRVDWNSVPWCECSAKELDAARLRKGDILFTRTGATTGKSYLVEDCPQNAVFASYLIRVRLRENVDPRYVAHFFRSSDYWRQVTANVRGVAQPGVNATTLKSLTIPLPSFSEQRRVADILDKAHWLRVHRQEALALIESLSRSIFEEMFGDPALNPHGWPWRTLGSIADRFSDGPFGSNLKSEHYVEAGVRVVRLQNIGVGEFVNDDKAFISREHYERIQKHTCVPGDVLVGTMGDPNLRACIQPDFVALAINKADCVQIRVNQKEANPSYVCSLLNHPSTEGLASALKRGQTRVRISMGCLRELQVPVPPLSLQSKFAERIGCVHELRDEQLKSDEELQHLFEALQESSFADVSESSSEALMRAATLPNVAMASAA